MSSACVTYGSITPPYSCTLFIKSKAIIPRTPSMERRQNHNQAEYDDTIPPMPTRTTTQIKPIVSRHLYLLTILPRDSEGWVRRRKTTTRFFKMNGYELMRTCTERMRSRNTHPSESRGRIVNHTLRNPEEGLLTGTNVATLLA